MNAFVNKLPIPSFKLNNVKGTLCTICCSMLWSLQDGWKCDDCKQLMCAECRHVLQHRCSQEAQQHALYELMEKERKRCGTFGLDMTDEQMFEMVLAIRERRVLSLETSINIWKNCPMHLEMLEHREHLMIHGLGDSKVYELILSMCLELGIINKDIRNNVLERYSGINFKVVEHVWQILKEWIRTTTVNCSEKDRGNVLFEILRALVGVQKKISIETISTFIYLIPCIKEQKENATKFTSIDITLLCHYLTCLRGSINSLDLLLDAFVLLNQSIQTIENEPVTTNETKTKKKTSSMVPGAWICDPDPDPGAPKFRQIEEIESQGIGNVVKTVFEIDTRRWDTTYVQNHLVINDDVILMLKDNIQSLMSVIVEIASSSKNEYAVYILQQIHAYEAAEILQKKLELHRPISKQKKEKSKNSEKNTSSSSFFTEQESTVKDVSVHSERYNEWKRGKDAEKKKDGDEDVGKKKDGGNGGGGGGGGESSSNGACDSGGDSDRNSGGDSDGTNSINSNKSKEKAATATTTVAATVAGNGDIQKNENTTDANLISCNHCPTNCHISDKSLTVNEKNLLNEWICSRCLGIPQDLPISMYVSLSVNLPLDKKWEFNVSPDNKLSTGNTELLIMEKVLGDGLGFGVGLRDGDVMFKFNNTVMPTTFAMFIKEVQEVQKVGGSDDIKTVKMVVLRRKK